MDWVSITSGLSVSNLILAALSIGWLLWRVQKVLETPVEELVRLLGHEVPAAPTVTLLDIATNSISMHLKQADQRNAAVKYVVRANGILVGEVSGQESGITIQDLQPGQLYIIRVIAVNATNFQASSEAIRVRTVEQSSHEVTSNLTSAGNPKRIVSQSVIPYKGFSEVPTLIPTSPVITREHSGSISHNRRGNTARRGSPAAFLDTPTSPSESSPGPGDGVDTVSELTTRLDTTRKEIEELERQDEEEDKEFHSTQVSLTENREQLRQQLKERDDESSDLRKTVISLERQNTASQTRKTKQEKLLSQKMSEREKLRDDVKRWKQEALIFRQEAEQFVLQMDEGFRAAQQNIETVRQEQDGDHQAIKAVEERIRETGTQVKDLEEEKKALEESPDNTDAFDRQLKQGEHGWNERMMALQMRHQSAWAACHQAQIAVHQAQQRYADLNAQYTPQANIYASQSQYPSDSPSHSTETQAVLSNPSARASFMHTESPRQTSLQARAPAAAVLSFQAPSPFFSSANLSSVPSDNPTQDGMSEADMEALTGGALASPTAGALLPAGLLGDDAEDMLHSGHQSSQAPYLPGLGAMPAPDNENVIEEEMQDVTSPMSFNSRSPSLVSSPQGSISNFHHSKLSESRMDSDRRSIRSTTSSNRAAPRRLGELFGTQRSRAASNEGLPLGSLNSYQSRSMPRQNEEPPHVSVLPRRVGSSGLFGSMTNALGRRTASSKLPEEGDAASTPPSASRGVHFGFFGGRSSPWARASSPRPASTYSMENALPRPSMDSQPFGWTANDALEQSVGRNGSLNNPWSFIPSSRRPSTQHDSPQPQSLLHNISQLDEDSQELRGEDSPLQAPIGTKPSKLDTSPTQKQLNPTARDFRSMLSRDRRASKARKGEKTPNSEEHVAFFSDLHPNSDSRKSKELRLSSAAGSSEELSDHGSSPSKTAESVSAPGSATKESFMRKMTRKGSSSKFSLGMGTSLFSRKGGQSDDVLDEDASSSLARSVESVVSGQQGLSDKRSGSSFLSFKRKKKGTEAPSISEASMASETWDEGVSRMSVDNEE